MPISWDTGISTTWSAVGNDNGGTKLVSFVVYNEDTIAHSFTIDAYDIDGNFAGRGFTPVIPPLQSFSDGSLGEGGTYGALIGDVLPNLPAGTFKFVIDGGPQQVVSAVSFLQFDGPSATSLQVAYDTAPSAALSAKAVRARSATIRQRRVAHTSKQVFPTLSKKHTSR